MARGTLSRQRILEQAVVVVDRDGLDALTMRRLGRELGVEAMSLYRYVTNKSDLLDGVFEAILGELIMPEPSGDWRLDVREAARSLHRILEEHPRALPLFATRPAITPASLELLEGALELLSQASLDEAATLITFQTLYAYVLGHAMTHHVSPDVELPQVNYHTLDPARLPRVARLGEVLHDYDPDAVFLRGLDALLAGLDAHA